MVQIAPRLIWAMKSTKKTELLLPSLLQYCFRCADEDMKTVHRCSDINNDTFSCHYEGCYVYKIIHVAKEALTSCFPAVLPKKSRLFIIRNTE